MIRTIALVTALASCVACMSPPATAADMPAKASFVERFTPAYTWTGLSLGLQGGTSMRGVGSDAYDFSFPGFGSVVNSTDIGLTGGIAGVRGDYTYQMGHFALGAFADLNKSWGSGSLDITNCPGCGYSDIVTAKLGWFGDAGMIAGVVFDRVFVYGLAGVSYGGLTSCENFTVSSYSSHSCTDYGAVGGTWGAGAKYAITSNLIAGVEWRHLELGAFSTDTTDSDGYSFHHHLKYSGDMVLGNLNWKF